ncbi:MAG: hypothetical protein LCH53_09665 [Bacteroidetes bacterium]|nr:hypothetical protein [Bacteroidota bacterium]
MKKIGILRGMEDSFPEGLIAHINAEYSGVVAEFVEVGAVSQDGFSTYDVILDRISHEVPFYRSYLKWAALKGTYVVNNPFWWSADDKFIDNVIAERVGVAVPKTVILPHKQHPPNTEGKSFRNLQSPLHWQEVFDYIGFPAFLKPHDGGGWRGVTKVNTPEELFRAYDESGTDCMMLQEAIEFTEYYRCYGVGQKHVHIMKYNPGAAHHERYSAVPQEPIRPEMYAKLERDVLALCRALGYDLNTVELAVRDGVPYAIDFMNPAPDGDYHSVTAPNYDWIVRTMGAFLVEKAMEDRPHTTFTANGALEPFGGFSLDRAKAQAADALETAKSKASEIADRLGDDVAEAVDQVKKAAAKGRKKVQDAVADVVADAPAKPKRAPRAKKTD